MVKRRVITTEEEDSDLAQPGEAVTIECEDLGRVLSELGVSSNAVVKVERIREGKRAEFVDEYPAAAFSLKGLQQDHGGGEYLLHGLDAKRQFVFRRQVPVAQPLQSAVPTAPAVNALDKLADVMRQGFEQQQVLLREVLTARPGVPATDPNTARREILQDLALMKEIMGGGQQQSLGPDKLLEVMKLGMDVAKDAAGGGEGWESIVGKAIENFGPSIAEAIASRQVATPTPAINHPAGMPPRLPAQPAAAPQQPKRGSGMKDYVGFLVERAKEGSDPMLYADLILDVVPEAMIRPLLGDGDPVARLAVIDPRVQQHAQWFRELGAALMEVLNSDAAQPGSDTPAGDGETGDAP